MNKLPTYYATKTGRKEYRLSSQSNTWGTTYSVFSTFAAIVRFLTGKHGNDKFYLIEKGK